MKTQHIGIVYFLFSLLVIWLGIALTRLMNDWKEVSNKSKKVKGLNIKLLKWIRQDWYIDIQTYTIAAFTYKYFLLTKKDYSKQISVHKIMGAGEGGYVRWDRIASAYVSMPRLLHWYKIRECRSIKVDHKRIRRSN